MGKKKPSIEQVDVKTEEQKAGINELLGSLAGKSGDILGLLGQQGVTEQPIYGQALGQLSDQIGQAFDPEAVKASYEQNVADPARKAYLEQTVPALQERLGRSSATGNLATKGAIDLEKSLAGGLSQEYINQQMRGSNLLNQALGFAQAPQQSQSQDIQALLSALGLGTGTDLFALQKKEGSPGWGGAVGSVLGAGLGAYLGGPQGAQIGGNIGGYAGSQF